MRAAPEQASEADFQNQIIDLAHIFGWRVAHFRPARTAHGWRTPVAADGAGFPDLVLVRGPRLIFGEVKSQRGELRCEQVEWLAALATVASTSPMVQATVWRPDDFDEIVATLSSA